MKSIRDRGVTYYILDSDYDGDNRDVYKEFIGLETLFVNDITIMYDWTNGLCLIEDGTTFDGLGINPLPSFILTRLLTDDKVHEWMHRSTEEDRLTVDISSSYFY